MAMKVRHEHANVCTSRDRRTAVYERRVSPQHSYGSIDRKVYETDRQREDG